MTGRCAKLHLPRFTSNSSGAWISTRWPTALVTTYLSLSKCSSCLSNFPATGVSARTMSWATDGFSAITKVLDMGLFNPYSGRSVTWAAASLQSTLLARIRAHVCIFKLTEFWRMAEKAVNGADTSPEEALAKSDALAGSSRRIQVRRSGVHGKGVFAVQKIAEGETIIEYVGEVINWKEALRRHPHDPKD